MRHLCLQQFQEDTKSLGFLSPRLATLPLLAAVMDLGALWGPCELRLLGLSPHFPE